MTNEQLIQSMFEAIDGRRWGLLSDIFGPEILYERPGYEPLAGIERVLKFYTEERIIASGQHMLEQLVINGPHAACWGTFAGAHHNGQELRERFADTYLIEGGRVLVRTTYFFRPAI